MVTKNINSVPFYFFSKLEQHSSLLHFVSTREGGVSTGIHSSLNLSLRVNDNPGLVKRNREIVANSFGIDPEKFIFSSQTHEDKVFAVDKAFLEKTGEEQNVLLHGVDAMVTNLEKVCLCILTADCASLLLYDPVSRAVGIAHAGWKGTVKKIAAKMLTTMNNLYESNPNNIIAAIGPCICAGSFEVGEEVAEVFTDTFSGKNNIVLRKSEWIRPHVDIAAANVEVLIDAGIKAGNIETSGICTYQNPDIFFSARKNAGGRFGSGIMLY